MNIITYDTIEMRCSRNDSNGQNPRLVQESTVFRSSRISPGFWLIGLCVLSNQIVLAWCVCLFVVRLCLSVVCGHSLCGIRASGLLVNPTTRQGLTLNPTITTIATATTTTTTTTTATATATTAAAAAATTTTAVTTATTTTTARVNPRSLQPQPPQPHPGRRGLQRH